MRTSQLAFLALQSLTTVSGTHFNLFDSPESVFCSIGDSLISTSALVQGSQAATFIFDASSGRFVDSNNKILCSKASGTLGASYLSFVSCDDIKANKLIWTPATFELVIPASGEQYFSPTNGQNWFSCGSRGVGLFSDSMPQSNGNAADDCVQRTILARPLTVVQPEQKAAGASATTTYTTRNLLVDIVQPSTQYSRGNSITHTRTTTISFPHLFPSAPPLPQIHTQDLAVSSEHFAIGTPPSLRTTELPNNAAGDIVTTHYMTPVYGSISSDHASRQSSVPTSQRMALSSTNNIEQLVVSSAADTLSHTQAVGRTFTTVSRATQNLLVAVASPSPIKDRSRTTEVTQGSSSSLSRAAQFSMVVVSVATPKSAVLTKALNQANYNVSTSTPATPHAAQNLLVNIAESTDVFSSTNFVEFSTASASTSATQYLQLQTITSVLTTAATVAIVVKPVAEASSSLSIQNENLMTMADLSSASTIETPSPGALWTNTTVSTQPSSVQAITSSVQDSLMSEPTQHLVITEPSEISHNVSRPAQTPTTAINTFSSSALTLHRASISMISFILVLHSGFAY